MSAREVDTVPPARPNETIITKLKAKFQEVWGPLDNTPKYDFIIRNDDTLESAEKKLQHFLDITNHYKTYSQFATDSLEQFDRIYRQYESVIHAAQEEILTYT